MWLPKYVPNFLAAQNRSARKGGERREKKRNCGMGIAKIEGEKRGKKKKNCDNSSAEIDGERREIKKIE